MDWDVIIVGGSYAGLSAALYLGRARRRALVIDSGLRRNRFAERSHGFLTRDGAPAAEIAALGKAEALAYPTVRWQDGEVAEARAEGGGFWVRTRDGQEARARRLILALGMRDQLPELPGLAARWGKSVFLCPYCHGYELDQGPIGVLAVSELSMHQALLLPDWGPTTLFLNQAFEPNEEQLAQLERRGARLERAPVDALEDGPSEAEPVQVRLRDGRAVPLAGLFTGSQFRVAGSLAQDLGCEFEESPVGSCVRTDPMKATSVPGVFACGDAARLASTVAFAVADGAMAGVAAHRSLVLEAAG